MDMEVSHNVGIKNRYSCFLLYGEGEVDDVSVAQESVIVKKSKSPAGAVVNTKDKLNGQPGQSLGKAVVKGKGQPQAVKKPGPGSTLANIPAATVVVKDNTDTNSKGFADKYGKGKPKGEYNQNDQRFQRSRYETPKTEEVVQEKDQALFNDSREENEPGNSDNDGVEPVDQEEELVEEAKLMTLAEYKASLQPREKPVYNLRLPGEGEDPSQWTKMVLRKEKEEEEIHPSEDLEYAADEYPQRAARLKKLEIDCLFVGLPREKGRGDGERDLRNKGRKNFNRRRFEENQANRSAPRMDDINDFPSLG